MRFRILLIVVSASACFKMPEWTGKKVDVTARERASIAKCGTGELTTQGAKLVTRHPYLQATTDTSTVIAWGSAEAQGDVVLTEPGGAVVRTVEAVYAGAPDRAKERLAAQHRPGGEMSADDIYVLEANLHGLEPGHLYCYQVRHDGRPLAASAPLETATRPGGKNPIRFVALGDTGTGTAAQLAIRSRVSAEPFDFMVFLGDVAYSAGRPSELQTKFFAIYQDFLKFVPAYLTIGNHERRTRQGAPYFEAFVLPEPERYYSFDWGDVHFVAIDTTQRDAEQLAWLDHDLAQHRRRWTIVFGHHAFYTNALRGPEIAVRRAFAKIVTRNKVDLVLTGHEHQYERFRIAGVNYVVSGGGGGQLHYFGGRSQALKQAAVHHFLAFEVSADKLTMRAIDIEGREIEKMELTKPDGGAKKAEVNDKPENKQNAVPPEKQVVPDEKVHDEPDDDRKKPKADPDKPPPPPPKPDTQPTPPVATSAAAAR